MNTVKSSYPSIIIPQAERLKDKSQNKMGPTDYEV